MKKRFKAVIVVIAIILSLLLLTNLITEKKRGKLDLDDYFSQLEKENGNDFQEVINDIEANLENMDLNVYEKGVNLLGLLNYNFKLVNINFVLEKLAEVEKYLEQNNMQNELLMLYEIICEYYISIERYDKVYRYIYKGEIIAGEVYESERTAENLS
ncbi:MAG: hypothetical protein ACRC68_12945 [Clostridium sp.]